MKIKVTISEIEDQDELNDSLTEQVAAANEIIQKQNIVEAAKIPIGTIRDLFTNETYLENLLNKAVESYAKTAYDKAVRSISDGAKQLTYAERKYLIAQVKSQLE